MNKKKFLCPGDDRKCDKFDQLACGVCCPYIRPGDKTDADVEVIER